MSIEQVLLMSKITVVPLAAAFIGALAKGWLENRRFTTLHEPRRLSGKWIGRLTFRDDPSEKLTFYFSERPWWSVARWLNPRMVSGTVSTGPDTIEFQGGFYDQEHVLLDYRAAQREIRQFGTMLLKLDSCATVLSGHLIGYYDDMFPGDINLRKVQ